MRIHVEERGLEVGQWRERVEEPRDLVEDREKSSPSWTQSCSAAAYCQAELQRCRWM